MLLNLTENELFFFLREAFCGLEYPENAFAAGAFCSGPHWGSSRRSPYSLVGWGEDTPPQTASNSAPLVPRPSGLPLVDIISGYATEQGWEFATICMSFPCGSCDHDGRCTVIMPLGHRLHPCIACKSCQLTMATTTRTKARRWLATGRGAENFEPLGLRPVRFVFHMK